MSRSMSDVTNVRWCRSSTRRMSRSGSGDPLVEAHVHRVAGRLADDLADRGLDRELVRPVTERHERALERRAVDRAADLDQAPGPEELGRAVHDDVGPGACALALLQAGGELLQHGDSFR